MQDLVLFKTSTGGRLTFDPIRQVTPVAVGHDNAQLRPTLGKEGIFVPHNVGMVQTLHELDFVPARRSFSCWNVGQFNAFHTVMFVFTNVSTQVDLAERPFADTSNDLVVF